MESKRKRLDAAVERTTDDPAISTAACLVLKHLAPTVASLAHAAENISACLDHSRKWTLETASKAGHVHLLDQLAARESPNVGNAFREARFLYNVWAVAQAGHVDVLSWWRTKYLPKGPDVAAATAQIAAYNDHLPVLQWIFQVDQHALSLTKMMRPLRCAQPEIVRWMSEHQPDIDLEISFHEVAARGDMGFITRLDSQSYACAVNEPAVLAAAASGHLDVLRYLADSAPEIPMQRAYRTAGRNGNLEMIKWFQGKYDLSGIPIIDLVIQNGHFHVVTWFVEHEEWQDERKRDAWLIEAMGIAASCGKMDVLTYLFSHRADPNTSLAIMGSGVSSGKIEIVEWLYAHGCDSEEDLVPLAVETGSLEMVQWVHLHYGAMQDTTEAIDFAAEYSLDIVKFLHEHGYEGCTTQAMDTAAEYGHLDIVRFLHENRAEGCTAHAMNQAAANGHLDIVKFLRSHRSEGVPARAMKAAASKGQLQEVQWLCENESINSEGVNAAYQAAIMNDRRDVVAYLAFHCGAKCRQVNVKTAVKCGCFQLLEWLMTHEPECVHIQPERDFVQLQAILSPMYSPAFDDLY